MKQWKRHEPMAEEEELDFEGDEMQLDEGSMLSMRLVNTQPLEKKEETPFLVQGQELQTRCKQPSWKSFVNMESKQIQQLTKPQECGQQRRRFKCIKRSLGR